MGVQRCNPPTHSIPCTFSIFASICSSSSMFPLSFPLLSFLAPFLSVAVTLVDQRWDLLYLLHISSAAPFLPAAPFIPNAFIIFFFTSRPLIMQLLCLYSLFTSTLLMWLTPEQREQQVWAEVREGHTHKYRHWSTYTWPVCVCMCVHACKQRYMWVHGCRRGHQNSLKMQQSRSKDKHTHTHECFNLDPNTPAAQSGAQTHTHTQL